MEVIKMYCGEIDEEVEKKLDEYEKIFPEGFPLMQFEGNKEELIEEINKCIKTKTEYDTSFYDNPDIDC